MLTLTPMKLKNLSIWLLAIAVGLAACKEEKDEPQQPNDTPVQTTDTPQQADEMAGVTQKIVGILNSYYADLSAENLDANKYFAPTVKEFYKMQEVSNEKVAESLQQGFRTMDDRKITLDPSTVVVVKTAEGYECIVGGTAQHTDAKSKKQSSGDFYNKIVFDSQFKIIRYNQTEDTRSTATMSADMAKNTVLSLKNVSALNDLMDDEVGTVFVTREGAFDRLAWHKDAKEMSAQNKILMGQLKKVNCGDITFGRLPTFDCDKEFSEKGCFFAPVKGYNEVSETARALNELKDPALKQNARQTDAYRQVEQYVTHELICTESGLLLGLGKVNGKWCVLVVDFAKFDCSA